MLAYATRKAHYSTRLETLYYCTLQKETSSIHCGDTLEQVQWLWDVNSNMWYSSHYNDNFQVQSAQGIFCY